MSKNHEPVDLRAEIQNMKLDIGLLQRVNCSKKENQAYMKMIRDGLPLPEGVFRWESSDGILLDEFYTVYDPQLTEKERQEYMDLLRHQEFRTIRRCAVFMAVAVGIGLAIALWILICAAFS